MRATDFKEQKAGVTDNKQEPKKKVQSERNQSNKESVQRRRE